MKGNLKKLLFLLLLIGLSIISVILVFNDEITIALFTALFAFFSLILLLREICNNKSTESIYNSEISDILKTYETILIELDSLPDLKDKNLVKTLSFKDIVNVEYEYRKPVYFVHNDNSYDFILINNNDVYTYTTKLDKEKNSLLEAYLDSLTPTDTKTGDLDIIDTLDKTTVIRLNDNKEYVVSPVRDKEEDINTDDTKTGSEPVIEESKDEVKEETKEEVETSSLTGSEPVEEENSSILEEKIEIENIEIESDKNNE